MKKCMSTIAALIGITSTCAFADINVIWSGTEGFLRNDDATGIMEPAGTGLTSYLQLIYTPTNGYGAAGIGGTVSAGEQILDTYVLADAGGSDPYGNFSESYSGVFQSGFIYARVFDGGTGNPANIVLGTWYYNGPIVATINNTDPGSPDAYNAQNANPSVTFGGLGDVLNRQVIPEPTTFALLGIGGLVLAARRRKV